MQHSLSYHNVLDRNILDCNNCACWPSYKLDVNRLPDTNGTNVANPIDKDNIIGDAEQIQLTHMRASAVELRAGGEELHCTGEHICQFDLRVIPDHRSLLI